MHEEVVQSDSVIFRRSQGWIECKDTRKTFPINITSLIDRYVKKSKNRNITRRLLNFLQKALRNERFGLHTEIPKLSLSNKSHKSFNTCRINRSMYLALVFKKVSDVDIPLSGINGEVAIRAFRLLIEQH